MKQSFSIPLILFLALLASTSPAQVATPAPMEITALKTRYRSDLQAAREPLREKYIAALQFLWRATTQGGNLDAALAVQQEMNTVEGKVATGPTGKAAPELTTLKTRYEADVKAVSDGIQARYITALQTLEDSFTKRGNLPAAVTVRQELAAVQSAPPASSPPVSDSPSTAKSGWKADLRQFLRFGIKELPSSGAGFYNDSIDRFKKEAQNAINTDSVELLKKTFDATQQDMFDGWVNVPGSPFVRWGGRPGQKEFGGTKPEYNPAQPLNAQVPHGGAYEILNKLRKQLGLPPMQINTQDPPDKRPKR